MNERQIRAFRLVMQHGSVTAASHALNISQPAVSRLIAELEHSIGFPLFLRKGGKLEPTAEGRQLMQEVERMFYGLERLTQVAREIRDLRRAVLNVAAIPMISLEVIPKTIARTLSQVGSMKIANDVHGSQQILDLLSTRQLDLGIGQMVSQERNVDVIATFRSRCVCAMLPDHPLASAEVLTPRDLKDHPLVALSHHTVVAGYVTKSFAEVNVSPQIAVESQPSYAACGLAAEGVGVAIVDPLTPRFFRNNLKVVPFEPEIPFDVQVFKPAGVPLSRPAEAFCKHLFAVLTDFAEVSRLDHNLGT